MSLLWVTDRFKVGFGKVSLCGFMLWVYSRRQVDRIWGTWGSYHNIPKAIFYLLKGEAIV